ncbi:MAG: ATP-binding protein [Acidobacteria bacterium]|nr:ATP-binding protein [Acidobacteriota bacterium]
MVESYVRLGYDMCREVLSQRLAEAAPSRVQILTGPRQVGKTTLLLDLAESFGESAVYAAGDGPEAALPGLWERVWRSAEEAALRDGRAVLFLDEVQHFGDWASRLKGEWDRLRRRRIPLHVVASGSSSLRLGAGSKESLAGRFERLVLAHWSARSLAKAFRVEPAKAADLVVRMGGYPGAFAMRADPIRCAAYLRDAILEPALNRDILALTDVRRPALLRQVFATCVASPAQIVSLQKIQGQLQDAGALETIAHYLQLLEDAYLVASIEKHSSRPARSRAAPPKLVVLNNGILAGMDPRGTPERSIEPARFGAWVENACLSMAWNSGQRLTYWREEPFEVDGVVEGSWGRWALEVNTGSVGSADLRGLFEFTRRFPDYRALVLCEPRERAAVERLGAAALSWRDFLLAGPPAAPAVARAPKARRKR